MGHLTAQLTRLHEKPVKSTRSRMEFSWVCGIICAVFLLTCAPAQPPESSVRFQADEMPPEAQTQTAVNEAPEPSHSPPRDEGCVEKIFSFAHQVALAHINRDGLLIDFGTPGRYKYTLQREFSGFLEDSVKEGKHVSGIRHGTSRIRFDAPSGFHGSGSVILAGFGESHSTAQLVLNGKRLGKIHFQDRDVTTEVLEFSEDTLSDQNVLEIHCGNPSAQAEGNRPCLSLDYIKIATDRQGYTETDSGKSGPAPRREEDTLHLIEGDALTYHLPLPEQSALVIDGVSFPNASDAVLHILIGDETSERAFTIERQNKLTREDTTFSLDEFSGQNVSITFAAEGGPLSIQGAALLAPRAADHQRTDATAGPMNVVLIVIDTLRADRLRPFNRQTRVRAPTIDEIARHGIVFERAWSQASWTKPSVATLLTGLYPRNHAVQRHGTKLPETVPYAPQHLLHLGFNTAGFVANGYISGDFGFDRGWNFFVNYGSQKKQNRAEDVFHDASEWIEQHGKSQPFFLYLHTVDPHAPYSPPKAFERTYHKRPSGGVIEPDTTAYLLNQIRQNKVALTEEDKQRLESLYDAEISYHDKHLAELIATIKKHGLMESTILIVTADHGEEMFDHGSVGHAHTLFEELIHVPLIMQLPRSIPKPTTRVTENVQLVDILPTICDILNVDWVENTDGKSLWPLMQGNFLSDYPRMSFADLPDKGLYAVRVGDVKAIFHRGSPTVFDLRTPGVERVIDNQSNLVAHSILRDFLGLHLSRLSQTAPEPKLKVESNGEGAAMSPEIMLQLKSLGYIEN